MKLIRKIFLNDKLYLVLSTISLVMYVISNYVNADWEERTGMDMTPIHNFLLAAFVLFFVYAIFAYFIKKSIDKPNKDL